MSDDRAAFEAWYGVENPPRFSKSGRYCRDSLEEMWCTWQAAVKHERERCADLCERLVRDNSDAGECADAIRNRESSTPKEE